MSIDQTQQIAQAYSWLRAMSGGVLTQDQVVAGDQVIATNGLDIFSQMIGFKYGTVTGQFDISENGYAIIREFEGLKLNAYQDTGKVWTIGFGTIKYPNGVSVKKGDTCTEKQANEWLKNDCVWVDACLDGCIKVKINQNQFDALASLVYNIGETQFKKSTMLKLLNQGKYKEAAGQFDVWIYDNGKIIPGLVNRRAKEKGLFLK